jgi:hypothetical protein
MALEYSYQKNPKRTANRNKSTIDGLLAGIIPATTRVTSATAVIIMLMSNERIRTK